MIRDKTTPSAAHKAIDTLGCVFGLGAVVELFIESARGDTVHEDGEESRFELDVCIVT